MRIFPRRKRVELGTYEAPEPTPPPAVESIVEDGMLIAESVLRMTLRNRMIVDALRDGRDLDRESLSAMAARELEALADNEWETAERLKLRRDTTRIDDPWVEDSESSETYRRESERREAVHRAMSAEFAARAQDDGILRSLVERSRVEAWEEVAPVIVDRVGAAEPARDEEYAAQRDERMGALLAFDLSALAHERGVTLE